MNRQRLPINQIEYSNVDLKVYCMPSLLYDRWEGILVACPRRSDCVERRVQWRNGPKKIESGKRSLEGLLAFFFFTRYYSRLSSILRRLKSLLEATTTTARRTSLGITSCELSCVAGLSWNMVGRNAVQSSDRELKFHRRVSRVLHKT